MIDLAKNTKIISYVNRVFKKDCMLYGLYGALTILFFRDPLKEQAAESFDRTFSEALVSGLSIGKRISNFTSAYIILFPLLFVLFTALFSVLLRQNHTKRNMDFIAGIGFIPMLFCYISRYTETAISLTVDGATAEIFPGGELLKYVLVMLMALAVMAFFDKEKCLSKEQQVTILLLSFIPVWSGMLLLHDMGFVVALASKAYLGYFAMAVILGILCVLGNKRYGERGKAAFSVLAGGLLFIPALLCIMVEVFYILTGRGVVVTGYRTKLLLITVLYVGVVLVVSIMKSRHAENAQKVRYAGFVWSMATINWLPSYTTAFSYGGTANLFEMGNTTSAINTTLYGEIPVANYFSAHLISDIWTRVLYVWLNGDIKGVLADPYAGLVTMVGFFILYLICKELFGKGKGIFMVMLLPICITGVKWTGVNLIALLALYYVYKKNSLFSYIVYWYALAFGLLYKLDDGLGLGVGAMVALFLLVLTGKCKLRLKSFFASAAGVTLIHVGIFAYGCLQEGVSVPGRFQEFIHVSLLSNATWALRELSSSYDLDYFLVYVLVPILTVIILGYGLLKLKNIHEKEMPAYLAVIVFGISGLFYISRTLVLHTLGNDASSHILFHYFHFLVAAFVTWKMQRREAVTEEKSALGFSAVFCLLIFLEGALVTGIVPTSDAIAFQETNRQSIERNMSYSPELMAEERIAYDEATEHFITDFNHLFGLLIQEEDTFVDFANVTGLYAMLGRENPGYVAQLPSLLTTEYSQRCFVESLERQRETTPLLITGKENLPYTIEMIGVNHSFRYYLVAEYLYQNYVPLTTLYDYVIWCRIPIYQEYRDILMAYNAGGEVYPIVGYDYNMDGELHYYESGMVAWLWANAPEETAVSNAVLQDCLQDESGIYRVARLDIDGSNGNFLKITLDSNAPEQSLVKLRMVDEEGNILATFTFNTKPGEQNYLLRISCDSYWHTDAPGGFVLELPAETTITSLQILAGD